MAGNETLTRNHWWWRPGWHPGRSFYTWHFLMNDQPEFHEFVAGIRSGLGRIAVLDVIPPEWLHLTTQGVGFADEVGETEIAAIGGAVTEQVFDLGPVRVKLGPVVVDAEGVHLPVRPIWAVAEVRQAIREAIGRVWGEGRVPETTGGFQPHVSLAYANATGVPLAPIRELVAHHVEVVPVTLTRVALIKLNRDEGMYRWTTISTPSLVDFGTDERANTQANPFNHCRDARHP